jgi:hypothetical protein
MKYYTTILLLTICMICMLFVTTEVGGHEDGDVTPITTAWRCKNMLVIDIINKLVQNENVEANKKFETFFKILNVKGMTRHKRSSSTTKILVKNIWGRICMGKGYFQELGQRQKPACCVLFNALTQRCRNTAKTFYN